MNNKNKPITRGQKSGELVKFGNKVVRVKKKKIDPIEHKLFLDRRRRNHYMERDFTMSFGQKIRKPEFCLQCNSQECNDLQHERIILNTIIRIPKKKASKKKWNTFFELIKKFHGEISS